MISVPGTSPVLVIFKETLTVSPGLTVLGLMIKEAGSNVAGRGATTGVVIIGGAVVVVVSGGLVVMTGGVVVAGGIGVVGAGAGAGVTAFTP